jgi:hypothetical protein
LPRTAAFIRFMASRKAAAAFEQHGFVQ